MIPNRAVGSPKRIGTGAKLKVKSRAAAAAVVHDKAGIALANSVPKLVETFNHLDFKHALAVFLLVGENIAPGEYRRRF